MKNLQTCRGCLATDSKLHNIHQRNLTAHFESIVGNTIFLSDGLPQYLCYYCTSLVIKFAAFKERCLRAYNVLINAKINTDHFKTIDFKGHNLCLPYVQTSTQKISIKCEIKRNKFIYHESTDNINHKCEDITVDTVKQEKKSIKYVKNEGNTDSFVIKVHLDEEKYKTNSKNETKTYINSETIIDVDIQSNSTAYADTHSTDDKPATSYSPLQDGCSNACFLEPILDTHPIREVEICNVDEPKFILQPLHTSKQEERTSKTNEAWTVLQNSLPGDECEKKVSKKPKKKIKQNLNNERHHRCKSKEDIDEFEKKYNFTVTYLSREQILKVVEDRQLSDKYTNAKYRCNLCYTGFLYNRTFNNHQTAHDPSSGQFVCEFCKCRFKGKRRLNAHIQQHKLSVTCNACGRILRTYNKAKLHHKWHNGDKIACKYCNRMLTAYSSYCEHLRVVHADQMSWCDKCGDTFVRDFDLDRHLKKAHNEATRFDPELNCSMCGTDFKSMEALRTHIDTSPGGVCNTDMRACFKCGDNFDNRDSLRLHYLNTHRMVECKECNKKFTNKTAYKMHIYGAEKFKTHSSGLLRNLQKHLMCEICGMTFQAPALLKIHHLKHSDEKPHKCGMCSKTFKYILGYKTHLYSHTGERPYKCSICPKNFKSDSILKRHELIHSGVRRHECHICGKFFKTSTCVKTHVNTVHMKIHKPKSKHKTESK